MLCYANSDKVSDVFPSLIDFYHPLGLELKKEQQSTVISPCLSPCCPCWGRGTWSWLLSRSSPLPGSTPGTCRCTHGRHSVWLSSMPLTADTADTHLKPWRRCADWTRHCGLSKLPRWPILSCTSVTVRVTGLRSAWMWGSSSVSQSWLATLNKGRCTVTSNQLSTC